jgi:hypothetical protein
MLLETIVSFPSSLELGDFVNNSAATTERPKEHSPLNIE